MEQRTEGAWLINHTKKLLEISSSHDFEDIEKAGKCGMFLSNLAASDEQIEISAEKVSAIAKVSNVKQIELPAIKQILQDAKLVDVAKNGSISVLGLTTAAVLNQTSQLFNSTSTGDLNYQKATLDLAEHSSEVPQEAKQLKEYVQDTYKLNDESSNELLLACEQIGLVDYEKTENSKLYFNGNLFRRENLSKTSNVLSSLSAEDSRKVLEYNSILSAQGCTTTESAIKVLGEPLLSKLLAIGMYDRNEVSNSQEAKTFITKPAAFAKFGNPFEEDALDLAKAFVSSLYYGMKFSSSGRGRIWGLNLLVGKMLRGYEIGPAAAIGEDYRILEFKGVVKIRPDGKGKYYMRLLKKDVGELALQVLTTGDASAQTLTPILHSGSVTKYAGPEYNRRVTRKKQTEQSQKAVAEMLRTFRTS